MSAAPGLVLLSGGSSVRPFPQPPTRWQVLNGTIHAQGLIVRTSRTWIGLDGQPTHDLPWWPACWAWLDRQSRAEIAPQLRAAGDTIMLMEYPCGQMLYDEWGQFYNPNQFPALSISDGDLVNLIIETIGYGFDAVWIFLGGDDGGAGYPIAVAQSQHLGPVLASSPVGDLNAYTLQSPGWDGVWHKPGANGTGYTPQQIRSWSEAARAAGARYLAVEGGTGYMLCGEDGGDYQPGGNMELIDVPLLEFDDGVFVTGDVWQILPRYFSAAHYVVPPEQIAHDVEGDPLYDQAHDPNPPWVCAPGSPRGPYCPRIFEYFMYGAVRGTPPATIAAAKAQFQAMVPTANIC